jgi:hypothetical protein
MLTIKKLCTDILIVGKREYRMGVEIGFGILMFTSYL